uniref:Sentrin-specific protease 7 n=2 Tax=Cacopsylla melanoneura TaxID=428564 RepID=A0A8D8Y097_9HEMI
MGKPGGPSVITNNGQKCYLIKNGTQLVPLQQGVQNNGPQLVPIQGGQSNGPQLVPIQGGPNNLEHMVGRGSPSRYLPIQGGPNNGPPGGVNDQYQMYHVEQEHNITPVETNSAGPVKIKVVNVNKPNITQADLKNYKILTLTAPPPTGVASPLQRGPRLLNIGGHQSPRHQLGPPPSPQMGAPSPEYRMMGSPSPSGPRIPQTHMMNPRPPGPRSTLRNMTPPPRTVNIQHRIAIGPGSGSPVPSPVMSPLQQQVCDSTTSSLEGEAPLGAAPSPAQPAAPVEEEKDVYKAGYLALCGNCGSLSARTNRCTRCNHKIPDQAKLVSSSATAAAGGGGPKGKDSPPMSGTGLLGEKASSPAGAGTGTTPGKPAGAGPTSSGASEQPPVQPARGTRSRKVHEEPPEILLISSDEEDADDGTSSENKDKLSSAAGNLFPTPLSDKEPLMNDYDESPSSVRVCGGGIPDDNVLDTLSEDGRYTHLLCRTIRIGSLKVFPREKVFISRHGIKLVVPNGNQPHVQVKIFRHEIVKVLAHFGKGMPVIFYYIRAHVGPRIRELLNMNTKSCKFYFDPSSRDETHRRITLLPEKIPDEVKTILSDIYSNDSEPSTDSEETLINGPCLEELSIKEANNILVKSSPPELRNVGSTPVPVQAVAPVQTIFIYKPTGISINTEDYACLDREQFINDVIIDFYLGFLLQEMATPQIKEKTHIFSTFFYKRLTQKPTRKVAGSIEGDPNVSAAKKRHSRVQSWTKNINVFEKDFIVVPINSNAHWFLAIICFPGLKGCVTTEGRAVEECQRFKSLKKRERIKLDEMQKTGKASGSVTIGNTTISPVTPKAGAGASDPTNANNTSTNTNSTTSTNASLVVNDEDEENRDEADSEDEDFVNFADESQQEGGEARSKSPLRDFEGPVRHPCILIFDSLPQAGNSRVRVVATLRDWLAVEYQVKHSGASRDFSKNVFIGAKPKVPMQTNYYDCGLYLLHYAERFFLDPLIDYRLPISLENWFSAYDTSRKRYDLQHLLFVLMERQGIDRTSLNLPHLNLDDPDYKSPEHEPETPDMIEAKYSAAVGQSEDGREEAEGEGEEEMGEEEEEEELEEGEVVRAHQVSGESSEPNNCDRIDDADAEQHVAEEEVEEESPSISNTNSMTPIAQVTPTPNISRTPLVRNHQQVAAGPGSATKQITIKGVKLKQISVTSSTVSNSSFTNSTNSPRTIPTSSNSTTTRTIPISSPSSVQIHRPRPKSKQLVIPVIPGGTTATRRLVIDSSSPQQKTQLVITSTGVSPGAAKQIVIPPLVQGTTERNIEVLKKNTAITFKRKSPPGGGAAPTSPSPAKKPTPTTSSGSPGGGGVTPPGAGGASGGCNVQGTNLRSMRIVKKMKTDQSGSSDGQEEEEEGGGS